MKSKRDDIKLKISSAADVVGFEIFDQSGKRIGVLSDIMLAGSSDVWVVRRCNEAILIPALRSVVREVNVLRKKIFVVLPREYEDAYYGRVKSVNDILEYYGTCLVVYED
ncbi:MAG: PRC-barrel domain-containing protein [Endomicrobium sp.]|jgi:16S rRNA processing protein RimM|nr:PRC-barrel domain-containing protein [Endomicrobium sp.]